MFWCCNPGCLYANDSRYGRGRVRYRAWFRYCCKRDHSQLKERSVCTQDIEVEKRLVERDLSRIQHQLDDPENDTIDCVKNDNRLKEVLEFVFSATKCLLDLHVPSNTSTVE